MEKSGRLQVTQEDLDLFKDPRMVSRRLSEMGVTSYQQLKEIIDAGEYEMVGPSVSSCI